MLFAKRVYFIAGVLGLVMLAPMLFAEGYINRENPPEITHPEFFYGFIGVGLAWQVVFLIIASDPLRYRPLMFASLIEKFSFVGACVVLHLAGRIPAQSVAPSLVDLVLGSLFVVAIVKTRDPAASV